MSHPPVFDLLRQQSRPAKLAFARQLRQRMTPAELALWKHLRGPDVPMRFRRQVVIAGYIADFYGSDLRLVIEVDGEIHAHQRAHDEHRDQAMRGLGLQVIRCRNDEVLSDPRGTVRRVLTQAQRWVDERNQERARRKAVGGPP